MTPENARLLLSNIAPIELPSAEARISTLPFESRDQMKDLRANHFGTHLFQREGARIKCIRLDGASPDLGDDEEKVLLRDHPSLSAAVLRHVIIDQYVHRGCEILDFRPIEIISANPRQNLLQSVVPQGTSCPDWLSVRQLCEMDLRVVSAGGLLFLGLVINLRVRKRILATCAELQKLGLELKGLYVAEKRESSDPRVSPPTRLIGRVSDSRETTLLLEDSRDDRTEANAKDVYIRLDAEAFERILTLQFGKLASGYRKALEQKVAEHAQGDIRLERIRGILADLQKQRIELLPGAPVQIQPFLSEDDERFPPFRELTGPVYVFDPAGRKSDSMKARGLGTHGPYTAQTFTPTEPRICIVCEASRKGEVERFLHKFLNGTDTAGHRYPPFRKGFCRGYFLKGATTQFFTAANPTAQAYRKAAQAALDALSDSTPHWDLALVQAPSENQTLKGEHNAYLVTKAAFHSQQIPVQEFEAETMAMDARNLEYALSNMALASYSKLGGIPWLIKADPTIAHEFVVGLGSSYVSDSLLSAKERVVGITTVFSGDGNYFLSNVSKAVPIDDFKEALVESLRNSFEQTRSRMNWEKGAHIRLVFHSFKPMKDAEAEAVKALAGELKDYSVEFAFINVVDDHELLLFDAWQSGEKDYASGQMKGKCVPVRGLYQQLSRREALLTLTGPKELKQVDDGMPFPVLLRLHRDSTFLDLDYLARQVFHFSAHSWRSFLPASMPVTIVYSQLIARLLGNLSRLPQWSPDSLRGRLGRSRWFL